jgi:hypothetical protein
VNTEYELTEAELMLLRQVVREMAIVEQLEAALNGAPLTVNGVRGAVVANPLLQELRAHRVVIGQLLARLKLPEVPDEDTGSVPGRATVTGLRPPMTKAEAGRIGGKAGRR